MLIPLKIGQNCTVRVPDVDRGPADPKNFLVVVMAECEGLYTVVPDTEIPLRTAVTKATGGQGYVKHVPIWLLIWSMQLQQKKKLKLVTGRPRHPQSQGAVERLNGVVQDKLAIWMRENGCKRWSMGLKFVQWQINVSVHETTGQSPFKVTFGEEPRIGLESYILPKSLVDAAKTEELIEEFFTSHEANNEDSLNRDGKNYDENESSIMKHLPETFIKARKEAALGQTRAAAKMTRRTKKMLIPLKIGQNCTVTVPDVDRGPADPKNFLVVVMAECEGLYTVGCREGKLASKFTAADLQVISENLLSIDEVPDTEIPLRTALRAAKDILSACAYLAAHLVDAVAAEKEYYAILVVTPGTFWCICITEKCPRRHLLFIGFIEQVLNILNLAVVPLGKEHQIGIFQLIWHFWDHADEQLTSRYFSLFRSLLKIHGRNCFLNFSNEDPVTLNPLTQWTVAHKRTAYF
ncbi:KRAB-A domain-containing protein 2 [Trichinella sp. T6]|nr:KRAB-A domain-containing protein 2 [Trichinella sp. T6]